MDLEFVKQDCLFLNHANKTEWYATKKSVPSPNLLYSPPKSRLHLHAYYERIATEAGGAEQVSFWGRPTATEAMMTMMLDHITAHYGNTAVYLTHCGLSATEIEQVRQRLWTP